MGTAAADASMPGRTFLHGVNTVHLQDPEFGDRYAGIDVFVVTLPQPAKLIAAAKRAAPGAIFLGYVNAGDLNRAYRDRGYWVDFWAAFPALAFVTDLSTGEDFELFDAPGGGQGLSHYVITSAVCAFWATWCRDRIKPLGLDGVYWDNSHWKVPPYVLVRYAAQPLDVTHDGRADAPAVIASLYDENRPRLTKAVRDAWPEGIQVCNTGGPAPDPNVNGITIESTAETRPKPEDFEASAWRRPVYAGVVAMDAEGDRWAKQVDWPAHVGLGRFTETREVVAR